MYLYIIINWAMYVSMTIARMIQHILVYQAGIQAWHAIFLTMDRIFPDSKWDVINSEILTKFLYIAISIFNFYDCPTAHVSKKLMNLIPVKE